MPDPAPIRVARAMLELAYPPNIVSDPDRDMKVRADSPQWADKIAAMRLVLDGLSSKFSTGALTKADVGKLLDRLDAEVGTWDEKGNRVGGMGAWADYARAELRSRLTTLSLTGETWASDALAAATDPWWRQLGG